MQFKRCALRQASDNRCSHGWLGEIRPNHELAWFRMVRDFALIRIAHQKKSYHASSCNFVKGG
jgi:hypothetical protein